jgi:hypothetical protein
MEFKDDNTIINTLNMKFNGFLEIEILDYIMRNHTTLNSYENFVSVTI